MRKLKPKKHPKGRVGVDEKLQMKVLHDVGYTFEKICQETGRGYKAVKKGLVDFEVLLVGDEPLYEKFEKERDKFVERLVRNAATLTVAADHQVARALPEATAVDAAKISQIYANRLDGLVNLSPKGLDGPDGKSAKVINFINQVFNITKNDRLETTPRTTPGAGGDGEGRPATGDAGVVQEGFVLPE
jgi:hypothetical protein